MNDPANSPPLRDLHFPNRRLARAGVEAITLSELRARAGRHCLSGPERSHMLSLVLYTHGRGQHTIDFEQQPVHEGGFILVRPGQMQRWHMTEAMQGLLVLAEPGVLQPGRGGLGQRHRELLAMDEWPGQGRLEPAAFQSVLALAQRLCQESSRGEPSTLDTAMMRGLLSCLLLEMKRALDSAAAPARAAAARAGTAIHRLLLREVEQRLDTRPGVQALAERLGYSASTLNRACRAATGRSAKQTIDQRIVLEARRLLVHTDASAAGIARTLGFSEATNFLKFFSRLTDETPESFRRFHRAGREVT